LQEKSGHAADITAMTDSDPEADVEKRAISREAEYPVRE
jgi:hypothetical protein